MAKCVCQETTEWGRAGIWSAPEIFLRKEKLVKIKFSALVLVGTAVENYMLLVATQTGTIIEDTAFVRG